MKQDNSADVRAIQGIFESAVDSLAHGRSESWASLYTEDCVFHPPGEPPVCGREALVAWGKNFPVESISWCDYDIRVVGDMAWGTSDATMRLEGSEEVSAKQLCVFQKINGDWTVVAVSFNENAMPTDG